MSRIGAALAGLLLLICPATASAQDLFDETPDLADHGRVDGWRVGKIDSDDVWLGQACILYRNLDSAPNPVNALYRFEPDSGETMIAFTVPQAVAVADPDDVDWGYLEPTDFIYALNGKEIFEISGHVGWDYVDANTVYVSLSIDADAALVDQIAAADWVGVAVKGSDEGMRFETGKTTRAVAWARQCVAGFN